MEKQLLIKELLKARYAHRGLHNKPTVPENSMSAFKKAVDEGFGIELDLHLTKDNKLAVIHDASLKRTCGIDLHIEDITLEDAQLYFLEDSNEVIPEFKDVLKLVDGKVPLLIELKVENHNHAQLCSKTIESLEGYKGPYCIESFRPEAIKWLRVNRPEIVRGQLAGAVRKDGADISALSDFLLRNLWVNILGKPDFVAYQFKDRNLGAFKRFKGAKFLWTIREYRDLKTAESLGAAAIFEKFDPNDYK
jgi:glycerophosphoryl diester phosphodiesterase